MGDTKEGREKQANDEERRQRERELEEALDRGGEPEPADVLGDLDTALENHDYPATTAEVIAAYGDREVETRGGRKSVDAVLASVEDERYDSPDDVRNRLLGLVRRD